MINGLDLELDYTPVSELDSGEIGSLPTAPEVAKLLLEDGSLLLQEDASSILI